MSFLPPPWVVISLALVFAQNIQDAKEIVSLGWHLIRGEDASCGLCDKLVDTVLKQVELDTMSEGGEIDCASLCFRFGACTRTCERITGAMANSTGFPCIAAGICPAEDEFGDVSCRWSYRTMGCEPARSCTYKFPACRLRSGIKRWKQVFVLLRMRSERVECRMRGG